MKPNGLVVLARGAKCAAADGGDGADVSPALLTLSSPRSLGTPPGLLPLKGAATAARLGTRNADVWPASSMLSFPRVPSTPPGLSLLTRAVEAALGARNTKSPTSSTLSSPCSLATPPGLSPIMSAVKSAKLGPGNADVLPALSTLSSTRVVATPSWLSPLTGTADTEGAMAAGGGVAEPADGFNAGPNERGGDDRHGRHDDGLEYQ